MAKKTAKAKKDTGATAVAKMPIPAWATASEKGHPPTGVLTMRQKNPASGAWETCRIQEKDLEKTVAAGWARPPEKKKGARKSKPAAVDTPADVATTAGGIRHNMQNEEGVKAVMTVAAITGEPLDNLIKWLCVWRNEEADRKLQTKLTELTTLEKEIAALKKAAGKSAT